MIQFFPSVTRLQLWLGLAVFAAIVTTAVAGPLIGMSMKPPVLKPPEVAPLHRLSPSPVSQSPPVSPTIRQTHTPGAGRAGPPELGIGLPLELRDDFTASGVIEETASMGSSASRKWWLNSGGLMYLRRGYAQTVQGSLPAGSKWQRRYASSTSADTDGGAHPQNVFRLVTRVRFAQIAQEAYFRVEADRLSTSPQRMASNGLLLLNRYQDGNNLYYSGLRVDGHAVIKKKYRGRYYTIAEKAVFPGVYQRDRSPNLLPKKTWIGVRSVVANRPDGTVRLQLWSDLGSAGQWRKILEANDDGRSYGGPAITRSGFGGIRTDFMDVSFRRFSMSGRPN